MTTDQTKEDFICEFRALLEKYDASIVWQCHWGSDLHGVNGREMAINIGRCEIMTVDGDSICSYDLPDS